MRTDPNPTAAYIASLAKELAVLAESEKLQSLAYLFRMAEIEANSINAHAIMADIPVLETEAA